MTQKTLHERGGGGGIHRRLPHQESVVPRLVVELDAVVAEAVAQVLVAQVAEEWDHRQAEPSPVEVRPSETRSERTEFP